MGKTGRFGIFSVPCFLALGGHCSQTLCLPAFGTRANTQNLLHFRAFPASIQEHCPPKCLLFMANAKLPNRLGFALPPVHSPHCRSVRFDPPISFLCDMCSYACQVYKVHGWLGCCEHQMANTP